MDLQLKDRTVVVTGGASSGVGLATARYLLSEGARLLPVRVTPADCPPRSTNSPGRTRTRFTSLRATSRIKTPPTASSPAHWIGLAPLMAWSATPAVP